MVGGGEGAFIGAVHRSAASLDGTLDLVCGAFSADAERSRRAGEMLRLDPDRCYADFASMFREEAALPPDVRMEFVAIVTPNYLHYPVARAALEHGFHVLSDKPATVSLDECLALRDQVEHTGLLYGLTHVYTSYPLIVEARDRVLRGELGTIRKVIVEYTQGWLAEPIEKRGNPQAQWRLDPARAGPSCCFGDIGVHAFNLAEFVAALEVEAVSAELNSVVDGRVLDDDGTALLRFAGGARGVLIASQICTGDENDLRLRVYGDAGALEWNQQEPNSLWLKHRDRPAELIRTGVGTSTPAASRHWRLPAGHPEGFIEAFANLYRKFGELVRGRRHGDVVRQPALNVPGIAEAVRGMAFIETVVAAGRSEIKWHSLNADSSAGSVATG